MANRGTDWTQARDIWVAQLPPRSYEAIAKRFGVSGTRVRFVARRDNWQKLADVVDAKTDAEVARRIVRSRAERITKVLGIVDGFVDRYDVELPDLELKPADLDRIVKLGELLEGEPTDRLSLAEAQEGFGIVIELALRHIPKKAQPAFLADVRERLGTLGEQAT